ncbi:50S ribosomal protein L24 [Verrucomicrobiota bacterium]
MSTSRVRKNDNVIVVSGVNRGKTGKVVQVLPTSGRALVEGLNLVKKTVRKSQDSPQGGIVEKENPIAVSNLMPFCPDCKRGVRLVRVKDGDRKVRKCRGCGHSFDA